MRKRVLFLALCIIGLFIKTGDCSDLGEAKRLFYEGNTNYNKSNFVEAAKDYEHIINLGLESGNVYYNLGNAYFKSGLLGKAILNYKRAKRLLPSDADLNSNLEHALSLIKNKVPESEKNIFLTLFNDFIGNFTLGGIAYTSLFLYILLTVLIVIFIILKDLRKRLRYFVAIFSFLFIVSLGIFMQKFYLIEIQKEAVVVVKSIDCKFEPFKEATTFFELNEGESVFILAIKNNWVKIQRSDGKQGWAEISQVGLL